MEEFKRKPINIPVVSAEQQADGAFGACSEAEPFALMVLGDSMEPEFHDREIIVIEPEGLARDGSYVIAFHNEEYTFRQLVKRKAGWALHALNPAYPDHPIADLSCVKGVVILKKQPGRRKSVKYYIEPEKH
jgi:SOS-response transcriptional repressors (RecA-mediated autopeptidases)